jgi:hypothetical protein
MALLLLEDRRNLEEAVGPLVRAARASRPLLSTAGPAEIVAQTAALEPLCSVTAAAWSADRLALAAHEAPVPWLLRFGRPVPFDVRDVGTVKEVTLETTRGDLLVVGSAGLFALASAGKPASAEKAIQHLARSAETQTLPAAFAALVAEWKKSGFAPGSRDVLLLAAKRIA